MGTTDYTDYTDFTQFAAKNIRVPSRNFAAKKFFKRGTLLWMQ
jgi:hypothetical protein